VAGKSGVEGVNTSSEGGMGVSGSSQGGGIGVQGSSVTGVGVSATSTSGPALQVEGVASFSRSGSALIAGTTANPESSVTVAGVPLSLSSLILATPQVYVPSVGVAAVVPAATGGAFTIYLTGPVEVSVEIAWFVIG
jgi:hypothetical protein